MSITVIIPWFFGFYKELQSSGYKLGNLGRNNGSTWFCMGKDSSPYSPSDIFAKELDLSKLKHDDRFYWLYKSETIPNQKPPTRGQKFWGTYISEFTNIYPIANIEIKDDDSAEIWVFGEIYMEDLTSFLKGYCVRNREVKITLELRHINAVI